MPPPQPGKRPSGDKKRRFPRRFGRYILEKTLSRGGMGEVFLAVVRDLEQRCVIKTIRGDLTGEEEFIGRFADEAKILVRAAHDNIIRYFDAGRVGSDYYIAMELVHGKDLGDVLDRAYERGEPMPPDIGLYITRNLLRGLHYAHELEDETGRRMGLVHRDISPQNVLIGFDGSVKLIDFGLARTDVLPNRTQGALAVGKYGYMSPEQARHEPLDGRADVYSTGVMLFEVFTGDRLVDEQDQSTLWQRVLNPQHRSPRSVLPTLSPEIDQLIMKAVAIHPADRFQSAKEMAERVDELRGRGSHRDRLKEYLRYLYPRASYTPPPIPQFAEGMAGVEKSVIFATSREGARSVFGRGELPIDGTMQLDAGDVRKQIDLLRARHAAELPTVRPQPSLGAPSARAHPKRPPEADPPLLETQAIIAKRTIAAPVEPLISSVSVRDPAESSQGEPETQVGRYPMPDEEATAFMRAPSGLDLEEGTLDDAVARPLSREDDERTLILTSPPQALYEPDQSAVVFDPGTPSAPLYGDETQGNEPTVLGAPSESDPSAAFDEETKVPDRLPGQLPDRAPRPTIIPHRGPADRPSPMAEANRRRAIRERVRTGAKRDGGVSRDVVRPPPRSDRSIAKAATSSPFFVGGLLFGAAAVTLVLLLALFR